MLSEVVFPVEGTFLQCLLLTLQEVVGFEVLGCWALRLTEYAMLAPCCWDHECAAIWTASPPFKGKMQRLLMSLPIIFRREGVCTEGTLEDTSTTRLCVLRSCSLGHGSPLSPTSVANG